MTARPAQCHKLIIMNKLTKESCVCINLSGETLETTFGRPIKLYLQLDSEFGALALDPELESELVDDAIYIVDLAPIGSRVNYSTLLRTPYH